MHMHTHVKAFFRKKFAGNPAAPEKRQGQHASCKIHSILAKQAGFSSPRM
jgi:hypothetical protein